AQGVTFLQFSEFTTYDGSPAPAVGRAHYRGPHDFHRLYACSDCWIAIRADGQEQRRALLAALEVTQGSELEGAFKLLPSTDVLARLAPIGVDAVRALTLETSFTDPFALANELTFVVEDTQFGRAAIVRSYSDWSTTQGRRPAAEFAVGGETLAILAEAGLSDQRIGELLNSGVVAVPASGAVRP
ncbi:MAG: hypothetical protein PHU75_05740, partial [Candidatus Nanopelagicales bacterium]|nr:hypothetical protein [Candidatus Nanopelagicales bacterium]